MTESTIFFQGHQVVDAERRKIGRISDVVYDVAGDPRWAVVDTGLLRSSHYVPVRSGYVAESGDFVVPYPKDTVKRAPRADRDHLVDAATEQQLCRHYELA